MQFMEVLVQEWNVVCAMRHICSIVLINENDRNLKEKPQPAEFAGRIVNLRHRSVIVRITTNETGQNTDTGQRKAAKQNFVTLQFRRQPLFRLTFPFVRIVTLPYVEIPLQGLTKPSKSHNFSTRNLVFFERTCKNPPRPKNMAYEPTADQMAKCWKCSNFDVSMKVSRPNGFVLLVSISTITLLAVRDINPICFRACITIKIQSPERETV